MAVKCILTGQTPSVLDGVTENVQTQIDAKAADNAVVHLTGNETISGTKTFAGGVVMKGGADVASSGNAILNVEGVATDTDYIDMYVSGGSNAKRPLVLQNNSSGSGNVGIGTATPSEKLEVVGNVKATKFKGDGSELTNVPYPVTSVAGKTGAVTLAASDVGAQPKITVTGILQGDGNGNITAVESIGAEVVTLDKSDVGLSNVDNTSDANKPISNATQAALNDKQSKITANGILKGDGTGNITAADETEVELVDLPIRAEAIIIPKGRMRGDVDGDGKITQNDIYQIHQHSTGKITLTGADLWCADANGNGSVTVADEQIIYIYLDGGSSALTKTPTFADYYNSWTYVKVDDLTGYWTTEISIADLTTSNNVVVNICETFLMGQFYKAEVSTGKVKIYATTPPITDIPAIVVISSGSGKGSIPSYLNDSSLDHKFSLNLPTASWTGSDPYTQTVTISDATANTKVDIQPSEEIYDLLVSDNVGYLAIKNVNGTLTAVAKGGKPSVDMAVQVTYNNVY